MSACKQCLLLLLNIAITFREGIHTPVGTCCSCSVVVPNVPLRLISLLFVYSILYFSCKSLHFLNVPSVIKPQGTSAIFRPSGLLYFVLPVVRINSFGSLSPTGLMLAACKGADARKSPGANGNSQEMSSGICLWVGFMGMDSSMIGSALERMHQPFKRCSTSVLLLQIRAADEAETYVREHKYGISLPLFLRSQQITWYKTQLQLRLN